MKRFIFLIICFFLVGCSNENIKSIVDNKNFTSINYPTTGISKLDYSIEKYINDTFNNYKNSNEYNVSYIYNVLNNQFISISLKTNIIKNYNKYNFIKTFNYDKYKNQFINLEDLSSDYSHTKKVIKSQINIADMSNFVIDNNNIIFYFKDKLKYEIEELSIPLDNLNLIIQNDQKYSNKIFLKERNVDKNSKLVALTFDDGPSKYTNKILDILKKEDICATFFIIGNKVPFYKNTLLKMVKNGNEIGNHSYDHKLLTRLSDENFLKEINKTQDLVKQYTGFTPKVFRPTYGGYSDRLVSLTNLKLTLWNVDSNDWKYNNSNKVINTVLKTIKPDSIILMHDIQKVTAKSVEPIIKELKKKGYTFVTISELNKIKKLRETQ